MTYISDIPVSIVAYCGLMLLTEFMRSPLYPRSEPFETAQVRPELDGIIVPLLQIVNMLGMSYLDALNGLDNVRRNDTRMGRGTEWTLLEGKGTLRRRMEGLLHRAHQTAGRTDRRGTASIKHTRYNSALP